MHAKYTLKVCILFIECSSLPIGGKHFQKYVVDAHYVFQFSLCRSHDFSFFCLLLCCLSFSELYCLCRVSPWLLFIVLLCFLCVRANNNSNIFTTLQKIENLRNVRYLCAYNKRENKSTESCTEFGKYDLFAIRSLSSQKKTAHVFFSQIGNILKCWSKKAKNKISQRWFHA